MDKKDFAAGIVAGAVLGALAGVLLAPKSGKETREDLKQFVDQSKTKIAARLRELKDVSREQYDRIVEVVVDEGAATLDVTKTDLAQLKNDLKERFGAIQARLKQKGE